MARKVKRLLRFAVPFVGCSSVFWRRGERMKSKKEKNIRAAGDHEILAFIHLNKI
jgi:hypothetical protein